MDSRIRRNHAGLAEELGTALTKTPLVLVRRDTLNSLDFGMVRTCNVTSCITLLQSRPHLSKVEDRSPLLKRLLSEGDFSDGSLRAAVRYLIHGDPGHFSDESPLMTVGDDSNIWLELMRRAFTVKGDERWRLVPSLLSEELTPNARKALRIQAINRTGVIEMLKHYTDAELAGIDVTELDREQLIREVDDAHVLAGLRVHLIVAGERTSIQPDCTYVATDYALPGSLADGVVLLAKEPKTEIRKRYTDFLQVPLLNAQVVLSLALNRPEPDRHWEEILSALGEGKVLDAALLGQLQETKWLPISDTLVRVVAPKDVIHISGMEEEITRLLAATDVGYSSVLQIDPKVCEHPKWRLVSEKIFPPVQEAIVNLTIVMDLTDSYHVGSLKQQAVVESIDEFVGLWQEAEGTRLQPVAAILEQIVQCALPEDAVRLWSSLCKPIATERTTAILRYLADMHEKASVKRKRVLFTWFNRFLEAASLDPSFEHAILPKIRLLNQLGQWRNADMLCKDYEGISRRDLLNLEQAAKLPGFDLGAGQSACAISSTESAQISAIPRHVCEADLFDSTEILHGYFERWEVFVEREIVGGFLCLMGDHHALKQLAESYLGRRHVRETRDLLSWKPLTGHDASAQVSGAGQDIHQVMQAQRFLVEIVDSDETTHRVISLVRTPLEASLSSQEEMDNLIVQSRRRISPEMRDGRQVNVLRLRQIDLERYTPKELAELLAKTALFILSQIYFQEPENFSAFWEDLQTSEQLDIESAQEWILRSIPHYLPQLGLRNDADLGPLIKKWNEADLREIESKHGHQLGGSSHSRFNPREVHEQIKGNLREILESDGEPERQIQDRMLSAMRRKISRRISV